MVQRIDKMIYIPVQTMLAVCLTL